MKAKREFTVVIERDEDGFYVGSVLELRGCYTKVKNLDTLIKRVREVIELCLKMAIPPNRWNWLAFSESPDDNTLSEASRKTTHPRP